MSISAIPQLDPYPVTGQQYASAVNQAFELAYGAGARGQVHTWTWKQLEPTQGVFDAQQFEDLRSAIAKAQSRSMVQYIGLQFINTTALEMPADLVGQPLDSAAVQSRFRALLDRVITPYKGKIKYLSLSNEVDAYLRAHPGDWARYKTFYSAMVRYARTLDPELKLGVTATAEGVLSLSRNELRDLNSDSDVVIMTYYPLQTSAMGVISVRDPSVVRTDFESMLAFAGSKPLVLQEVGYPAAASNGSSEARQAAFVSNVFAAWRAAPGRIPLLNFFPLHDYTAQMCADFGAYYGLPGVATFTDFLCSLGLRRANGTPRTAWSTLQTEAQAASLP